MLDGEAMGFETGGKLCVDEGGLERALDEEYGWILRGWGGWGHAG